MMDINELVKASRVIKRHGIWQVEGELVVATYCHDTPLNNAGDGTWACNVPTCPNTWPRIYCGPSTIGSFWAASCTIRDVDEAEIAEWVEAWTGLTVKVEVKE